MPQPWNYSTPSYQGSSSLHEQWKLEDYMGTKHRAGSPVSSSGSEPLDLTAGSTGSKDSHEQDNQARITLALRDNDLDVSLENEGGHVQHVNTRKQHEGDRNKTTLRQLKRHHKSSTDLVLNNSYQGVAYPQNAKPRAPLKSKSLEYLNQRMVDIDIGEGQLQRQKSYDDNLALKSMTMNGRHPKDHPPPLMSCRLCPIRQQTRNAIANILPDGWVCLEFIKRKNSSGNQESQRVVEVIKISPNGMKILAYTPNKAEVSDEPPPPPLDPSLIKAYDYETLPKKYWRKYQFATKFVNLIRSKTPKVTLYTQLAKCMLMENAPEADFEVLFFDGKCNDALY